MKTISRCAIDNYLSAVFSANWKMFNCVLQVLQLQLRSTFLNIEWRNGATTARVVAACCRITAFPNISQTLHWEIEKWSLFQVLVLMAASPLPALLTVSARQFVINQCTIYIVQTDQLSADFCLSFFLWILKILTPFCCMHGTAECHQCSGKMMWWCDGLCTSGKPAVSLYNWGGRCITDWSQCKQRIRESLAKVNFTLDRIKRHGGFIRQFDCSQQLNSNSILESF